MSGDALLAAADSKEAHDSLHTLKIGSGDVASFQLSGGTTGIPKIVPRFHAEYLGSTRAWAARIRLSCRDTLLWALPLIHNAAQVKILVPAVLTGSTVVLMPRMDAPTFFDWIGRERVTIAASIGPIASQILD